MSELRQLAREEPEAFKSVIGKSPDGPLKDRLEEIFSEETEQ